MNLNQSSIILDAWDSDMYKFNHKVLKDKLYNILKNENYLIKDNDLDELIDLDTLNYSDVDISYKSVCKSFVGHNLTVRNNFSLFKIASVSLVGATLAAYSYLSYSNKI